MVISGQKKLGLNLCIALNFGAISVAADQLPSLSNVVSGGVEINSTGSNLTITQSSNQAILDWNSFNIGSDAASAMLMKRLRRTITDKKVTMHSLRHRMKDKLRNTGCPEAIFMAILGHSANTVAANYGSGYALEVMREHMEKVWDK